MLDGVQLFKDYFLGRGGRERNNRSIRTINERLSLVFNPTYLDDSHISVSCLLPLLPDYIVQFDV